LILFVTPVPIEYVYPGVELAVIVGGLNDILEIVNIIVVAVILDNVNIGFVGEVTTVIGTEGVDDTAGLYNVE
jgi:hypothetical protein